MITLHEGDNRESLRRLIAQGVRVHSVVTDPPYGLVSIQKRFGKEGSKPARTDKNDGSFARLSGGFMGRKWDGTGIERDPEFWALVYDILLPGGYVFAFSGSRTGHWQAVAMELAGFIMHPMHGWCFGSGFPKAHNPRLPEWEGYAYGTQAQKPALEPIYLGQKPFSEKTGAANLLKHGVGAVNIDGCRVPTRDNLNGGAYAENGNRGVSPSLHAGSGMNVPGKTVGKPFVQPEGRHPANLLLDGSPEVLAMFPDSKGQLARSSSSETRKTQNVYGDMVRGSGGREPRGDEGSAARFFHQFPRYACEQCNDTGEIYTPMACIGDSPSLEPCACGGPLPPFDPLIYHGKANKHDRAGGNHPTVKPINLMRYLIRHITPPGGTMLDPFAGSGTTAEAARLEGMDCILMEAEPEYVAFLRKRFDLPRQDDNPFAHLLDACPENQPLVDFEDLL